MRLKILSLSITLISISLTLSGQSNSTSDFSTLLDSALFSIERGFSEKAYRLYKQAATVAEENTGTESSDYATALNGLGLACMFAEEYEEAKIYVKKALQIQEKECGKSSSEYAETLCNWGFIQLMGQKYSSAMNDFEESAKIMEKIKGKHSYEYANSITGMGYTYLMRGDTKEAKKLLLKASDIYKVIKGDSSSIYSESIYSIGTCSLLEGDYATAEKYLRQCVDIDKIEEEGHPYHLGHIINLTTIYLDKYQNLNECNELLLRAKTIHGKFYSKPTRFYADILTNLGATYIKLGEFENTVSILEESTRLGFDIYGEKHPNYIKTLSALAAAYMMSGKISEAEPVYLQSLKLRKKVFGEKSLETATLLINLGNFYFTLGNKTKAADYYLEALEVVTKNKATEKSALVGAQSLKGIALVSDKIGDSKMALSNLQYASELQKEVAGENLLYLSTQDEIINLHQELNYPYGYIEVQYKVLLDAKESLVGINHPSYIQTLNNLAQFYSKKNKYEDAIKTFNKALNLIENQEEKPNSGIYKELLFGMGMVYSAMRESYNALPYFDKAVSLIKDELESNFTFLTEREQEEYWNEAISSKLYYLLYFYTSYYSRRSLDYPARAYDIELLLKSILLSSSRHIQQAIQRSGDHELIENWNYYRSLKQKQVQLEFSFSDNSNEISALEKQSEEQRKNIIRNSREYNQWKDELSVDWKTVQNSLCEQDAAIEFVLINQFDLYDQKWTGRKSYYALILKPSLKLPVLVKLCKETELESALINWEQDGLLLYNLIWKPIEDSLSGVKQIYLSTTGLLNRISFAGIKKDNSYICDEFDIHNLLSTRDIVRLKKQQEESVVEKRALFFGGADYGLFPLEIKHDGTRGQGFSYLAGSQKEVESIQKKLNQSGWKTELYTGRDATKTSFISALDNALPPKLIHISTHGFYFTQQKEKPEKNRDKKIEEKNIYYLSENPLIRSGLAFAGANYTWTGRKTLNATDNGILTAYEISCMNLEHTDLVVLSACNTALGDASYISGEGVYGLQRAFRLAGVQTMIVSLWEIPDKETVELMEEFYSQWEQGHNKKQAFTISQKIMRNKYPDSPEKWAGFVMIE